MIYILPLAVIWLLVLSFPMSVNQYVKTTVAIVFIVLILIMLILK